MEDKLTKQDQAFIKEVIETGNATEAVIKAYNPKPKTRNAAGVKAYDKLRNPKIINAIQSIADSIPEKKLVEVHLEGLQAGKHIYKNNVTTGEIEEVGFEEDYAVRHKYLDSAYKLKGSYSPEKSVNININTQFSEEERANLLKLLQ